MDPTPHLCFKMYARAWAESVLSEFLIKHKSAWKEIREIWKIPKAALVWYIRLDDIKWRNFKFLVKRVEKGCLADIWLEEKEVKTRVVKLILKVFRGTIMLKDEDFGKEVPYHEYRFKKRES